MEFKYIIIDKVKPVLFSHGIEHKDEANGRNVTSAGFVKLISVRNADGTSKIMLKCFGRSESLNIDNAPDRDQKIIKLIAETNLGMGAE